MMYAVALQCDEFGDLDSRWDTARQEIRANEIDDLVASALSDIAQR